MAFPRKAGKTKACAAWKTATQKVNAAIIIEAARRYAEQQRNIEERFVKHPATWLAEERWADGQSSAISVSIPDSWSDHAPALLAEIGLADFGAHFGASELDAGPPVTIRMRSEFLVGHVLKKFRKPLTKVFGSDMRVVAQ